MSTVVVETNHGSFTIELDAAKAPKTVANFLSYVDDGHYADTVFHRVISGFMVQGGGYDVNFNKKDVKAPVVNEADNGLTNQRGTVAMARTSDPNSATAQFFVNHSNNTFLNHREKSSRGWGYAVFGKVTEGMEVVDAIAACDTGAKASFSKDAPLEDVVIKAIGRS